MDCSDNRNGPKCDFNGTTMAAKAKLGRVLVIEHDQHYARIYRHCLRGSYELYFLNSADQALKFVDEYDPDVVVLDADLPNEKGAGICQKIREFNTFSNDYTGIVLLTESGQGEAIRKGSEIGADSFCVKEFSRFQLLPLVRSVHRFRKMTDQLKTYSEKLLAFNAELEQLSITDELTGLYNMRHVKKRLKIEFEAALRYKHKLAILMIDIDHFKKVNDGADHLLGSYVIGELGKEIKRVTRDVDIPGRYGGDEFIVLLPNTGQSGALKVAQRLKDLIKQRVYSNGYDATKITISQGLAVVDGGNTNLKNKEELMRLADRALYQAKDAGRNAIVCYDPEEDDHSAPKAS